MKRRRRLGKTPRMLLLPPLLLLLVVVVLSYCSAAQPPDEEDDPFAPSSLFATLGSCFVTLSRFDADENQRLDATEFGNLVAACASGMATTASIADLFQDVACLCEPYDNSDNDTTIDCCSSIYRPAASTEYPVQYTLNVCARLRDLCSAAPASTVSAAPTAAPALDIVDLTTSPSTTTSPTTPRAGIAVLEPTQSPIKITATNTDPATDTTPAPTSAPALSIVAANNEQGGPSPQQDSSQNVPPPPSSETDASDNTTSDTTTTSTPAIVGGIAAGAAVLALLGVLIVYRAKEQRERQWATFRNTGSVVAKGRVVVELDPTLDDDEDDEDGDEKLPPPAANNFCSSVNHMASVVPALAQPLSAIAEESASQSTFSDDLAGALRILDDDDDDGISDDGSNNNDDADLMVDNECGVHRRDDFDLQWNGGDREDAVATTRANRQHSYCYSAEQDEDHESSSSSSYSSNNNSNTSLGSALDDDPSARVTTAHGALVHQTTTTASGMDNADEFDDDDDDMCDLEKQQQPQPPK